MPKRSCYDCKVVESRQVAIDICLDDELRCLKCKRKRWPDKSCQNPVKALTLTSMKDLLEEDTDDIKNNILVIKKSMIFLCEFLDHFKRRDEENQEKLKVMSLEMSELKEELKDRKQEVTDLTNRVEEMEQKDKINNVIINGLDLKTFSMVMESNKSQGHDEVEPSPSNKVVMIEKLAKFAKDKMGVNLQKTDIKHIFSIKSKKNPNSNLTKVIFSSNSIKSEFYAAKKKLYQNNVKNVYINEDLIAKNFELLMEARRRKKQHQIENAWTHDCIVFIKTLSTARDKGRVISIRKKEDFAGINQQ